MTFSCQAVVAKVLAFNLFTFFEKIKMVIFDNVVLEIER